MRVSEEWNEKVSHPLLDRTSSGKSYDSEKKRILSMMIFLILILSLLSAQLAFLISINELQDDRTSILADGIGREVTWTISNMFEMYYPDWDWNRSGGITFEELNRHQSVDGTPGWYYLRDPDYGEKILRNTYPHIFYYDPYSSQTSPDVSVGYHIWAPYRMNIMARNISDCHTSTGDSTTNNVFFSPDLDGNAGRPNTGWINLSYYGTYMTTNSMNAAYDLGNTMTHYARWLFGCAQREVPRGSTNDDGYWFELMGKIQYSRQAAIGFLGWDGTGDVRSWFNATNAARALDNSWLDVWSAEGGSGGAFDIYTAYDYPVDIRVVRLSLDLQNSTADSLVIRMYSVSWGMEVLMVRYMEAANITKKGLQSFMEDFYLNASVSPSMSNITCRATCSYDLIAWEDQNPAVWSGAWMLEMMHIDRCGNTPPHIIYDSPYTGIDPDETDWLRPSYSPWTTNYCNNVSYWRAPLNNSLAANEKMIFKLPQNDVLGIKPGRGTSDNLDASKLTELKSNLYWGRMVLGSWNWPNQTVRDSYDKASKTVTLQGPAVYPNESQPLDSTVLLHGVPMLVFDVQRATSYQVSVSGPLVPPTKNSVTVTIKNHTGATVTDWNGTVDLSSTDVAAVFDEISHVFSPSDGGTWRTNVTFVSPGWNLCVNATDRGFSPLNLKDAITGSWMGPIIPNNPPTASFTITPGNGDLSTIFIVNASESFDPEDGYNLQYRWDWEADGTYDTVWSTNKTAQHQYPLEGNYTIRLEVKDMWDLTDTEEKLVTVIIPEFASIALVIALTALMFIIFSRKRRG